MWGGFIVFQERHPTTERQIFADELDRLVMHLSLAYAYPKSIF